MSIIDDLRDQLAYERHKVSTLEAILSALTARNERLTKALTEAAYILGGSATAEKYRRILSEIDSALSAPRADEVEAVAKAAANRIRYVWDGLPESTGREFPCTWRHADYGSIANISKEAFRDLARDCISALDAHRSARKAIPSGLAEEFERLRDIVKRAYLGALVLRTICKKQAWELALEITDSLLADMAREMPELPGIAALRQSRQEDKP